MRSFRALALPLAAVACLAACGPAAAAPTAQTGVVIGNPFADQGRTFPLVSRLHPGWVRSFLFWREIEPTRGHFNQGLIDAYVSTLDALHARGSRNLIVLVGTPSWESGTSDQQAPPRRASDFAALAGTLAARLGSRVDAWEIWNEEDAPIWWSHPDPRRYVALLSASYRAIKRRAPRSTVLFGGLTGNDYDYLARAYRFGARGHFDAVAVHTDTACDVISPYVYYRLRRRLGQFSFLGYRSVRAVMLAHGDRRPIWMTELGWSTSTAVCDQGASRGRKGGGVSPDDQAAFLRQAYHCLAGDRYVQVAIWFSFTDLGAPDTPNDRFGLLTGGYAPKPAFAALADVGARGDGLTGPCGDFAGPKVTIADPVAGSSYRGPLRITATATDPRGVGQLTFLYDGHLIRHFTGPRGTIDWQHAKHISRGRHRITVLANDALGNVGRASVVVYNRN